MYQIHPKKIVLLGMMTKIPVAGAVWGTLHLFDRLAAPGLSSLLRRGARPHAVHVHGTRARRRLGQSG